MGNLVEKAIQYAILAHSRVNHLRKYNQQPYGIHLKAVAKLVSSVTEDEVVIAAAWLHDTVEDTPATFEDIEKEFGTEVMELVKEVTNISREFDPRQILDFEASLADVIHVLKQFTFCFISVDGHIFGVISREDIEKPVVRMWIFGIITTIEMIVVSLIRRKWPDDEWVDRLSAGRVEKARQMQSERLRRGLGADLLDCLQFSDKMQIALKEPSFLEGVGFSSVSTAQKAVSELESLRNDLAHGQNIAQHDWFTIARLARWIEQMYGTWHEGG
jgi:hypothetical protein